MGRKGICVLDALFKGYMEDEDYLGGKLATKAFKELAAGNE